MEFWINVIIALLVISFVSALFSLKKELSRPREIEDVKKELTKEKVIFRA